MIESGYPYREEEVISRLQFGSWKFTYLTMDRVLCFDPASKVDVLYGCTHRHPRSDRLGRYMPPAKSDMGRYGVTREED